MTNSKQRASTPIIEEPRKRGRVERQSEVGETLTQMLSEALLEATRGIEAAIDRQTEVLAQIRNIMESRREL